MNHDYNEKFYSYTKRTALADGRQILPQVIHWLSPKSIVDFGCGNGTWLDLAKKCDDAIEILGLDGYDIDEKMLDIPQNCFMRCDLTKGVELEKRYDLAISTEVAEHLEERFADSFIDSITRASDNILFSAAVPGQGGTHHVNEQWQSYWIEKFAKKGYYADFSVRNFFWNNENITPWRRQNLMMFKKTKEQVARDCPIHDVLHPGMIDMYKRESELDYYLRNPFIASKIDESIRKLLRITNKIVIYPYGQNGRICQKLLNSRYGVEEFLIVDNLLSEKRNDIISVEQLKQYSGDDFIVIDTCSKHSLHAELLKELLAAVDAKRVFSVF